jgi:hypothetical protein
MDHSDSCVETRRQLTTDQMCRAESTDHRYYCTLIAGHSSEVLHEARNNDGHRDLLARWAP